MRARARVAAASRRRQRGPRRTLPTRRIRTGAPSGCRTEPHLERVESRRKTGSDGRSDGDWYTAPTGAATTTRMRRVGRRGLERMSGARLPRSRDRPRAEQHAMFRPAWARTRRLSRVGAGGRGGSDQVSAPADRRFCARADRRRLRTPVPEPPPTMSSTASPRQSQRSGERSVQQTADAQDDPLVAEELAWGCSGSRKLLLSPLKTKRPPWMATIRWRTFRWSSWL